MAGHDILTLGATVMDTDFVKQYKNVGMDVDLEHDSGGNDEGGSTSDDSSSDESGNDPSVSELSGMDDTGMSDVCSLVLTCSFAQTTIHINAADMESRNCNLQYLGPPLSNSDCSHNQTFVSSMYALLKCETLAI